MFLCLELWPYLIIGHLLIHPIPLPPVSPSGQAPHPSPVSARACHSAWHIVNGSSMNKSERAIWSRLMPLWLCLFLSSCLSSHYVFISYIESKAGSYFTHFVASQTTRGKEETTFIESLLCANDCTYYVIMVKTEFNSYNRSISRPYHPWVTKEWAVNQGNKVIGIWPSFHR